MDKQEQQERQQSKQVCLENQRRHVRQAKALESNEERLHTLKIERSRRRQA